MPFLAPISYLHETDNDGLTAMARPRCFSEISIEWWSSRKRQAKPLIWAARCASAAVQKEAPSSTRSLIRNCPASPRTGKPYFNCAAPGVENRKLTVSRKVTTAAKLPTNDAFGESGRSAMRAAVAISMTPIRLETPCTPSRLDIHDMSGLCSTNGWMAAASPGVNFSTPIPVLNC